jgi:ABC-type phosphate transport system auxiliary subunit|tara:strand:+ start:419 stop:928 length:510 start_codon:yes stop_codon:yes gene_type:complete
MEGIKATTILNDILQKLSLLTNAEELSEDVLEQEVQEEVIEAASDEASTEEVKEESTELEEAVEALEPVEEETQLMDGYVTDEEFASSISALRAELDALKGMLDGELSLYKSQKEELSKELEKLSAEPAAEPIKHSPENELESKANFSRPNSNRAIGTMDRVMARLNNK